MRDSSHSSRSSDTRLTRPLRSSMATPSSSRKSSGPLDPELIKYLYVIMKNIERLDAFIERILTSESFMESLKEEG